MTLDDAHPSRDAGLRCSSCGARNAGSATWCSLCLCPLGTEHPDVEPVLMEPVLMEPVLMEPVLMEPAPEPEAADRGAVDTDAHADAHADALLAELAAHQASSSAWQQLGGLVGSPAAKAAVMVAGTLLVAGLGFAAMALLGSLL
jgi:hypothetical protein